MANSNEYMAQYMRERYALRRAEGIALLGGACVRCGAADDLQFDHIDKKTKLHDVSTLINKAWSRFQAEVVKCQLLCHECHRLKSADELSVPHGGGVSGKKNCRCLPCRERKAEYQSNYTRLRSSVE